MVLLELPNTAEGLRDIMHLLLPLESEGKGTHVEFTFFKAVSGNNILNSI